MRQITRPATSMAGAGRRTGQLAAVGDLAHHDVPAVLEPDAAHVGADMVPHLARLQSRRDLHARRSQRRASLAAHAEQLPRQLMLYYAACSSHTQRVPHLVLRCGDEVVELVCLALELELDAIKAGEDGVPHACAPPASSAQRAVQRVRLASTPAAGLLLTGGAQPVDTALGVHQTHHLLPR